MSVQHLRMIRVTFLSAGLLALSLLFVDTSLAHSDGRGDAWYRNEYRNEVRSAYTHGYQPLGVLPQRGGGVSIRASAGVSGVMQGGLIRYTLFIHNDDLRDHRLQVRAALDPDTWAEAASDRAVMVGDLVEWSNVTIPAGRSKSLTLQVRVKPTASVSRRVRLTAYIPGSSDMVETDVQELYNVADVLPYYYSYNAGNGLAYPSPTYGRNVYFHPPQNPVSNRNMFFGYVPAAPSVPTFPCDSRVMRCY